MKKLFLLGAFVFATNIFAINTENGLVNKIDTESIEDFKSCPVTIKGTYDGKEVDLVVTVEADDCAKAAGTMLKEVMKQ
ncbi:hypothetical protein [Tenacibaculum agarivorans]|uniref:hypothetical protein n=1 Tax=Tenacibaculum agarivorans TaxID=1908389 RepID=UPI00094BA2C9|nr:hypothetical protein [Tenacibaculum agarivorans]